MEVSFFDKLIEVSFSFLESILFLLTAFFIIFKKKKINLSDIFLFCFWLSTAIAFFIIFVMLLSYHFLGLPLEGTYFFLLAGWVFLGASSFFIFLFLLSKISIKTLVKVSLAFILVVGIFLNFLFYFKSGRLGIKMGDPFLYSSFERAGVYFLLGIIFIYFLLFVLIIREDFLKKKISWFNLSLLYNYFALFLYGIISFIRIFFFYPRPVIIEMFYFLIPYLVYLARKEELKTKHEES